MNSENWQERTELLLGKDKLLLLNKVKVLLVGLGGVGAYSAEMLARAGVGELHIIDGDNIHPSNCNRQLLALGSTNGLSKAVLMEQRLMDINVAIKVKAQHLYINKENIPQILEGNYDYIVDAIDTLSPKIALISNALKRNIPIISSMGSGGKTNPSLVRIADFEETYNDKLARMLRKRMHKRGIYGGFKVVFSPEQVNPSALKFVEDEENKKTTLGTISYMPTLFGTLMAAEVIRNLCQITDYQYNKSV